MIPSARPFPRIQTENMTSSDQLHIIQIFAQSVLEGLTLCIIKKQKENKGVHRVNGHDLGNNF